jgi:hypothetical protein
MVPGIAMLCTACQVYTPISLSPQTAPTTVRVTLNDGGSYRLQPSLGANASALQGQLLGVTDSTMSIKITQLTRVSGVDETWNGEPVTLPRDDISLVERRTTSVARSVLVAAAIVGVAVAAGTVAGTASGAPSPTTPGSVK